MIVLMLTLTLGLPQESKDEAPKIVVDALIDATRDPSSSVRTAAYTALGTLESSHEGVFRTIVRGLREEDETVRNAAWQSFLMVEGKDQEKIDQLMSLIHDENPDMRLMAFGELRRNSALALGPLTEILNSNMLSDENRYQILNLMRGWGSASAPAVSAICEVYRTREEFRGPALETLAAMGPAAKESLPLVVEATKNAQEEIRLLAVTTLGSVAGNPDRLAAGARPVDERFRRYAQSMMERYDSNRNGLIDGDEFDSMRSGDQFDLNGDRRLSVRELEQAITRARPSLSRPATGRAASDR